MYLAKNLAYVESQTGQDPWTASPELVRMRAMEREVVEPPPQDTWRLPGQADETAAAAAQPGPQGGGGEGPAAH